MLEKERKDKSKSLEEDIRDREIDMEKKLREDEVSTKDIVDKMTQQYKRMDQSLQTQIDEF